MTNIVVIGGRLTNDAQLLVLQNGANVCNFTIANNKKYKESEKTTFIDIIIFGEYAKSMHQYLKKGLSINVIGQLIQEAWEHDGKNYYKHKIRAMEIDFRTLKNKEEGNSNE